MIPAVSSSAVPVLTKDQMVEVDRLMIEDLRIDLVRMMENAGRNLARLVTRYASNDLSSPVVVLAGTGGNGGGALVAARRLVGWGFQVQVLTTHPASEFDGVIAHQLAILAHLGVPIASQNTPDVTPRDAVIVDGLVGYSLSGTPRGRSASLITWANEQDASTIALDVPTGFDAGSESIREPAIIAEATLTLALPKRGLTNAREHVGTLYCCDIGVPSSLYTKAFGIDINGLFTTADIVKILPDKAPRRRRDM